jgi:hypothetical protein
MGIQNLSNFLKDFLAHDYLRINHPGATDIDTILIDGTGLLHYIIEKSKIAIKKIAAGDFALNHIFYAKHGYYPINDNSKEYIIANVLCKYIDCYIKTFNPKNIFVAFDGKCANSKRCLQKTRIKEREQKELKNPIEKLEFYKPEWAPASPSKLSGKKQFGISIQEELKNKVFRGRNFIVNSYADSVGEGENKIRWYLRDHPNESCVVVANDNDMIIHLLSQYNNQLTNPGVYLKREFSPELNECINIITLRNICLERFGQVLKCCKQQCYIKDPAIVVAYTNLCYVSHEYIQYIEQRCIRDLIGIMCLIQSDYIPKLHNDAMVIKTYFSAYLRCKLTNMNCYLIHDFNSCNDTCYQYDFFFIHELYKIVLMTNNSNENQPLITDRDPNQQLSQSHYYVQYMLGQSLTMQNFLKGDLPHYKWEYFGSRAPTIREFVYFFELARYYTTNLNSIVDQSFNFDFNRENEKMKKISCITI